MVLLVLVLVLEPVVSLETAFVVVVVGIGAEIEIGLPVLVVAAGLTVVLLVPFVLFPALLVIDDAVGCQPSLPISRSALPK